MWIWIVSLFTTRYRLTVSYNNTRGDSDDQEFIVKKMIEKVEK